MKKDIYYADRSNEIYNVIIVDADKDFEDNPLFYVWGEYPKYSKFNDNGRLSFTYEFYTDARDNRYFVISDPQNSTPEEMASLILRHDWDYARNVDAFVNGADKKEYARWLELIS
jgi:hypothetical protein